jgi:hypothetical protein
LVAAVALTDRIEHSHLPMYLISVMCTSAVELTGKQCVFIAASHKIHLSPVVIVKFNDDEDHPLNVSERLRILVY